MLLTAAIVSAYTAKSLRSCARAKIEAWPFVPDSTLGDDESSELTFSVSFTG